jgi:glycine cleavage system T protein (aminomethyltransferase)
MRFYCCVWKRATSSSGRIPISNTTPSKLGADWAVKMQKPDFIGKEALLRMSEFPIQQRLAPIRFDGTAAPPEGAVLLANGQQVGHLTSSGYSPVLGYAITMGWIRRRDTEFPTQV